MDVELAHVFIYTGSSSTSEILPVVSLSKSHIHTTEMAERDEKLQQTPSQEAEVSVSPSYNDPETRQAKPKIGEGRWFRPFFEPGSAVQIICAAVVAIIIGMVVNVTVDEVPPAAIAILGIPGRLWLRALQAVGMSSFCIQFVKADR